MKAARGTLRLRVVDALRSGPMTVVQLSTVLDAGKESIRQSIQRLHDSGEVRHAGHHRTGKRGPFSYVWARAL